VTRHSQKDQVEKEEKCQYEAFVTDPCTCGLGSPEITNNVGKKKTCRSRLFCRKLTVGRGVLGPAEHGGIQVWKKKKTSTRLLLQIPARNQGPYGSGNRNEPSPRLAEAPLSDFGAMPVYGTYPRFAARNTLDE